MFETKKPIEVPKFGPNESTWCLGEFFTHGNELKVSFLNGNSKEFKELYDKCLQEGKRKKKKFSNIEDCENIDNTVFLVHYNFNVFSMMTMNSLVKNNTISDEFKSSHSIVNRDFFSNSAGIGTSYIICDGKQTFGLLALGRTNEYLLLNPNSTESRVLTGYQVIEYIGDNLITIVSII